MLTGQGGSVIRGRRSEAATTGMRAHATVRSQDGGRTDSTSLRRHHPQGRHLRRTRPAIREAIETHPDVMLRDRRYRRSLIVADVLAALSALLVAGLATPGGGLHPSFLIGLPLVVLVSKLTGLYDRDQLLIRKTTIDEAPKLLQHATLYTLLAWLVAELLLGMSVSAGTAAVLWVTLWVLSIAFRRVARAIAARIVPEERLLLIGDAATYSRLADKLDMTRSRARLVGRLSLQRVTDGPSAERVIDRDTMSQLVRELDVHRILISPSQTDPQLTLDLVRAAKAAGVRVSVVPHVLDVVGSSVAFDDLGGMTLLGVREFELSRSSHLVKRGFDLVGAGIMLLVVAPLMALIALAIKLDSPGPVFFRQERIGKAGRPFRIFKFRTMVPDAEERKAELLHRNEADGILFKIEDDPRITRVGRFLRRTSLDELPQLFNVIRGEMSLVGPRPLICAEDSAITGYDRRWLRLTPGMTGHWQIMGSARVPTREMVKIDYVYVTTWSLFEDIKILVGTIPYMLARRGM